MKRSPLIFALCAALAAPCAAEEKPAPTPPMAAPPSQQPQVDPNKLVTMTVAELEMLLARERANAAASGVITKLNAQLQTDPPKPKP